MIVAAFIIACFLAGFIVGAGIALMALKVYSQDSEQEAR